MTFFRFMVTITALFLAVGLMSLGIGWVGQ